MAVRIVGRRLAMGMLTVLAGLVAVLALPRCDAEQVAAGWAVQLSRADIEHYTRPGEWRELPVSYRRELFARLTDSSLQAGVWQGVFGEYRHNHSLSSVEDEALRRAEALIEPVFDSLAADEGRAVELKVALASARDGVRAVLGPEAERELFLDAGPPQRTRSLPLTERMAFHATTWFAGIAPTLLASPPTCNCNSEQGDCYYSSHCTAELNQCQHVGHCGPWWGWTCDGMCNYGPQ